MIGGSSFIRYNPNCRSMLEEYVQYQIENRFYDFDANMALLKMYQFDPSHFQAKSVTNILLLALTNLPKADLLLCKYLLDTKKVCKIDTIEQ
jgi:translation initiation factor 3 subunit K